MELCGRDVCVIEKEEDDEMRVGDVKEEDPDAIANDEQENATARDEVYDEHKLIATSGKRAQNGVDGEERVSKNAEMAECVVIATDEEPKVHEANRNEYEMIVMMASTRCWRWLARA